MLLVYSSFFLGIIHIYGLYLSHWMGPAFFIMTVLSISNHFLQHKTKETTRKNKKEKVEENTTENTIRNIDIAYAHLMLFTTMIEASMYSLNYLMYIYWICVIWIVYVYRISKLSHCENYGDYWHSTTHMAAAIGNCAMLYNIQCSF